MKTISTQFRRATLADSSHLVNLLNDAYRPKKVLAQAWTHEAGIIEGNRISLMQIQEIINQNDSVLLVAKQNQQLVGCVHLEKQSEYVYISMLTVDPKLQSQGLGKTILSYAEDYALNN